MAEELAEKKKRGRAVLVGAGEECYLDELGRLAETLGLEVAGRLEQSRRDGAGYLGRGKREELRELVGRLGASFVLADDELSASQARVLERDAGATVVDRTELIIRIFEAHARDAASRLQVELADLEYRLPRLKGRNPELSRLAGGGGGGGRGATRGPGEQQLEYDRRAIRERISVIRRKLRDEEAARKVRGSRLRRSGPPSVALVGYTNAGKTTILNRLSGAGKSTRDWLFETLETTTRLVEDGGSRPDFVLTDTVGFIRKLPAQLVHSFASTLEAARDADVLVICADASSPDLEEEVRVVRNTLSDLLRRTNDSHAPAEILCFNKTDLLPLNRIMQLRNRHPDALLISALEGGCEPLLERIYETISGMWERVSLLVPHSEYGIVSRIHGRAEIHSRRHTERGVLMEVTLPREDAARYEGYRVAAASS
ncbi:GTPase HflX [Rubrobacter xylanophilus DSM 9941]|uniref:GTPase HflX n=1 Tax=Rubrobacter xylanophilus TaxID=49319 RepID=UPI001C63D0DC|nr:GTPase HflX [Rubrobacter xylanophilus]QYJ14664.1 GTPase HflX [Rubrobacter xylanophilus DSM 9941]